MVGQARARARDDGAGGVAEEDGEVDGVGGGDELGVDGLDGDGAVVADRVEGADQAGEVGGAVAGHEAPLVGGAPEVVGPHRGRVVDLHGEDRGAGHAARSSRVDGPQWICQASTVTPTSRDGRSARTARKSSIVRTSDPRANSIPTRTSSAAASSHIASTTSAIASCDVPRSPTTMALAWRAPSAAAVSSTKARGAGPEVRLARIVRTRPRDERVDFVGDDTGVVEHPAQLLGVGTRLERGPVRLRRPEGEPGEPAAHRRFDQRGERRAPDRRRGEHQVVAPQGGHGRTYTWVSPTRLIRETPPLLTSLRRRYRTLVRRVPDERARRRPGDAVRVVVAAIILTLLALHANNPSAAERALARFFRLLPDDADSFVLIFYDLMALWALALVAFALVLVRRWRLARDVAAAGALAWVIGRLVAVFVDRTDLAHAFSVTFDLTDVPRFPLVRISMAVAVITVASPYLARPTRRVGQGIVLLLAIATMYIGQVVSHRRGRPRSSSAGASPRSCTSSSAPPRAPDGRTGDTALADLDVRFECARRRRAAGRARDLLRRRPDRAAAHDRDRSRRSRRAAPGPHLALDRVSGRATDPVPTRRQQVEYEAYTMLLAHEVAARVPHVVIAGTSGSLAVLVTEDVHGHPLDADAIDDAWEQVRILHHAHIAHGRLDAEHLVVNDGNVTVVGWGPRRAARTPRQLDADVAHLLAATAAIVGADRAVAAAIHGVGTEQVTAALPLLQPGVLSGVTRSALDDAEAERTGRTSEKAADAVGTDPPELQELYRVNPRRLLMAVGALIAIAVLLSRVGDPVEFWDSIRDANWAYVALALGLGILTDVAYAVAFLGTVPVRIPLWPSIELQSSMSFSNLAVPVAADTAIQIRFLQKFGLDLSSTVATGGIFSTLSELIVQGALFGIALWLSPDSINFGRIDTNQIVVVVLIVILLIGSARR